MTTVDAATLAHQLIETVARVLGSQPGCRVTHEDGIVLTGTFTATPQARTLTRAAHMQGEPVRVTVRFSNGFPDPGIVDAAEDNPRGMAVEITGPDTERDGDVLVNDPMRLTDGIEPSDDPILRIRTHVYAESVRRRTS